MTTSTPQQADFLSRLAAVQEVIDSPPNTAGIAHLLRNAVVDAPGVTAAHVLLHGQLYPPDPELDGLRLRLEAAAGAPFTLDREALAGWPDVELIPLGAARCLHGFLVLSVGDRQDLALSRILLESLARLAATTLDARDCRAQVEELAQFKAQCYLNAQSEEKYRSLVAAMAEGAVFLDENGVVIAVNPAAERILGRAAGDMLGSDASGWAMDAVCEDGTPFPPGSHPFMVTLRTGEPQSEVVMGFHRPDGAFVWVSVNSQPLQSHGEAKPHASVTTFHDITAHRYADQERLAHLEFFENMDRINRAMQGTNDLEQMLADVLDAALSIFECDAAGLIYPCDPEAPSWRVVVERRRAGSTLSLAPDLDRPMDAVAAERFRAAEAAAGPVQFGGGAEIALALRPKTGKPWLFVLQRVPAAKGWTPGQEKLIQETGRRLSDALTSLLAYRDLRASERKYEEIFDNVSDALFLLDVAEGGRFRIADLNPVAAKLIGPSSSEEVNAFFDSVADLDIVEQITPRLRRCVETRQAISCEELIRFPTGLRFLRTVYVPLCDEEGTACRILTVNTDIASLKATEEALRLSEERYRSLVTATSQLVWVADSQGNTVEDSPSWLAFTGQTLEEGRGRGWLAAVHPDDRERVAESWSHAVATGEPFMTEYRVRRFDGEYRCFINRGVAVPGRDGAIREWVGACFDITESKKAEEALRESDAKLREAQEMAEVASWDWDFAANALRWSAGERRLLGRDSGGSPGAFAEFLSFVHPDDRKRLKEGIDEVRRTGEPFQLEYRIVQPMGEVRTVDAHMKGFRSAGGDLVRIRGVVRDITKAKQTEERLKVAWLYARSLIEASIDPLMTISPKGMITDVNEAAVRVLDAPRDRIVGSVFANHFTEPERAALAFHAALATGTVSNYPLAIRQSSNELIHVFLNASIYRNARGEPEGVFAAARDVTEQNRRSQELVKLHEQMTDTVAELRQREHDTAIIDELSETLQTCKTRDEAYPLIGAAGRQLFPWSNGGLAVVSPGALDLHTVAVWGDKPLMLSDFDMDACWALRRGQLHALTGPGEGALCAHFEEPPAGPSMCLPMAIAGEALGMLHLNSSLPRVFDDRVRRLMVTLGDVVKLSLSNLKLRETLRIQAIRDPLTDLFNRHYLNETLPREILRAQRLGLPLCVAMLDVDHFKQFNDLHGHDAGDMVLKEVGNLLRKAVRESDMACRYGGEEFLFVLPECDLQSALARMQQIRDDVRTRTHLFHGRPIPAITLSVGLAQLSDETSTQSELIAAADEALYAAKNAGRDRACVFSDGVEK